MLAAILLIVGLGLCLFHASDGVDHNLCLAFVATALTPLLAFPLAPTGEFRLTLTHPYPSELSDLLPPPPEA